MNIVEYGILNPRFKELRIARIEIFDRTRDTPYQIYEGYMMLPEDIFLKNREVLDFYETDLPIRLELDTTNKKYFPDIYKYYYGDSL